MIITLPWPNAKLSPNARLHWRAKINPKRNARQEGEWLTKAAEGFRKALADLPDAGPIPITVTFFPPDRRHRDDDNMIASFKHSRDGIASALGVDDRRFRPTYKFAEPAKPGCVEVVL